MGAGDLFGEMTCMNFYPRSATVRAAEDCTRAGDAPQRALHHAAQPDVPRRSSRGTTASAPSTTTSGACRSSPASGQDEAEFEQLVDYLRDRVQLRRCEPGEMIFRQGDPADDGFYLVRTGFVKVSQNRPGGEHVLNYVGPGGYFGEIGLLSDIPEIRAVAPPGVRTATCTALDHVDLVRITAADFRDILDQFPDQLRQPLVEGALQTLERDRDAAAARRRTSSLGDFLGQGLMNAQSLLVLDLEKCTRCDECTKACADAHDGVTRLIREGLRFDKFLVASSCRSCLDPYCMVGCPVGSIRRREHARDHHRGLVHRLRQVRRELPVRQHQHAPVPDRRDCAPTPTTPARMIPVVQQKATTCDLCHDLGPNAEPSCVYACPHDAAHRMTGSDLRAWSNAPQPFNYGIGLELSRVAGHDRLSPRDRLRQAGILSGNFWLTK